jgi:hypothetical protein
MLTHREAVLNENYFWLDLYLKGMVKIQHNKNVVLLILLNFSIDRYEGAKSDRINLSKLQTSQDLPLRII